MFRKIRAMLLFAREVQWTQEPEWKEEDSVKLLLFLESDTGQKFSKTLANMVIRNQSYCLEDKKDLVFSAGFANGFKGCVSAIESLANKELYEDLEGDEPSDLET